MFFDPKIIVHSLFYPCSMVHFVFVSLIPSFSVLSLIHGFYKLLLTVQRLVFTTLLTVQRLVFTTLLTVQRLVFYDVTYSSATGILRRYLQFRDWYLRRLLHFSRLVFCHYCYLQFSGLVFRQICYLQPWKKDKYRRKGKGHRCCLEAEYIQLLASLAILH